MHCGPWSVLTVVLIGVPDRSLHGLTTESLYGIDAQLPAFLLTLLGLAATAYAIAVLTQERAPV